MSITFFIWDFGRQSKNMEKLSQIRAQLFLHNRYAVFTMGGTVALWIVDIFFPRELQFCSLKYIAEVNCLHRCFRVTHLIMY